MNSVRHARRRRSTRLSSRRATPSPSHAPRRTGSALKFFFAIISLLFALPRVSAHAPGESALVLSADAEGLEAVASLSFPSAAALLPADLSPALSPASFEQHRPALLLAAARVCTLLDTDGAAIAPDRVLVSLHDGHEVRFHFIHPASARPARLRVALLPDLPPGFFFELTDRRALPARFAVLTSSAPVPEFTFAAR